MKFITEASKKMAHYAPSFLALAVSGSLMAEEATYAENLASDLDKVENLVEQVPVVAPHLMQTATMIEYSLVGLAVLYLLFRFIKRNGATKRGFKGPVLVSLLLGAWLAFQFMPMFMGKTEDKAPEAAAQPAAAPAPTEPAAAPVTTSEPTSVAPTTAPEATTVAPAVEAAPAAPAATTPTAPADQKPAEPAHL